MSSSTLSTHVLDTAQGRPAAGVNLALHRLQDDEWVAVATATSDADGRASGLAPAGLQAGTYRLWFDTGGYFPDGGFYPEVTVVFIVAGSAEHYHVPLLLSPYGYSTYRGS